MPDLVVVDTDLLIDWLRGRTEAIDYLAGLAAPPIVSALSVSEIFAGARDAERTQLEQLLSTLRVVDVTGEIARDGGLLRRDFGPSHGTGLVDAIIAATARWHGAALATLNRRHYPMIDALVIPY